MGIYVLSKKLVPLILKSRVWPLNLKLLPIPVLNKELGELVSNSEKAGQQS